MDITISVSQEQAAYFTEAVNYYNESSETEYTPKEMVKKLAREFFIEQVRAKRNNSNQVAVDTELEGL